MKKICILLVVAILFSCKTDKKQEILQNDTIEQTKEENFEEDILKSDDTFMEFDINQIQKLIGKTYQYLDDFDQFKNCRFGGFEQMAECEEKKIDIVKVYSDFSNNPHLLILVEKVNDEIEEKFKILDVLDLSQEKLVQDSKNIVIIAENYIENEKSINIPIAVIKKDNDEEEFFTNIYKIWRVDCKKGKFVENSIEGIKIENKEYYGI